MNFIPYVIEKEGNGERSYDLNSRLLKDRIIKLTGPVNQQMADIVTSELFYLESQDPKSPIKMYINSEGGEVISGLAIYDVMQHVKCPVMTIVNGLAASIGSVLLTGGSKGMRYAMPNSEIMIHEPSGGSQGKASDMRISMDHMNRMHDNLKKLYVKHTGKSYEEVSKALDHGDNWMTLEEALKFGLIDKIVE